MLSTPRDEDAVGLNGVGVRSPADSMLPEGYSAVNTLNSAFAGDPMAPAGGGVTRSA
jgi:hypothetical protein